jgi:DNA-binding transcriptional LysR family regulator
MARTRPTAHKSIGHQPTGQLAPRNMPPPQKHNHDSPPHASQEEEPFEIELVVSSSPTAQGAPAEEQEQQEDHNVDNEDEDDKEYSPLSDNVGDKLYRDADKRESFSAEASIPTGRLRALLGHLGITSAPRYLIKRVPRPGWVEFKVVAEIFSGPRVLYRHRRLAFRASIIDAAADAA